MAGGKGSGHTDYNKSRITVQLWGGKLITHLNVVQSSTATYQFSNGVSNYYMRLKITDVFYFVFLACSKYSIQCASVIQKRKR